MSALRNGDHFEREGAATYFAKRAAEGNPDYTALGALVLAAKRYADWFGERQPSRVLPISQASFAIMKIVGAEHLSLDWSANLNDLRASLAATAQTDPDVRMREEAQKYLDHWDQISSPVN